jgi:hypothetical protein
MKLTIVFIFISLLFPSCKDQTNPIPPDQSNPYAQKSIIWPSLKNSPWPMYRHDPQLTGRSAHSGPKKGIIAGTLPAGDDMAGIVIDNDSIVYVHSSSLPGSGYKNLTVYKYNGVKIWDKEFHLYSDTYTSPILTSLGFLYFSNIHTVASINFDSTTKWKTEIRNVYMYSPTIDKTGNLYLTQSGDNTVISFSSVGNELWRFSPQELTGSPRILSFSPDGRVLYVLGHSLVAIDITSKSVLWSYQPTSSSTSPVIDAEGHIYFVSSADTGSYGSYTLHCIYPNGTTRWIHPYLFYDAISSNAYETDITIDWDGNIYHARDTLYSFTNNGILRWKFGLENNEKNIAGLVCDINNTIFILTNKNKVYAISQSGNLLWKVVIPLQGIFGMSPSIADGKLFIPTWVTDRKIFIIE